MSFKSALTFHHTDEKIELLEPVIEMARKSGLHLDIVVIGVLAPPPVVLHDVAPATEWVAANNETITSATKVANLIENLLAEQGVSGSVTSNANQLNMVDNAAAPYALGADFFTLTKDQYNAHKCYEKAFDGSLFRSRCPFLYLPKGDLDLSSIKTITIAWNGKAEAANAIHRSMSLLTAAKQVNLVSIDPKSGQVGDEPGSDIAAFLARHDVNVAIDAIPSVGKSIEDTLIQHSTEVGSDLIVMGAYGHSKFREWLIGGTTKYMLEKANIPVFMVH